MTAVLDNEATLPRSRVRVAPAPATAPPFDDELGRWADLAEVPRSTDGPPAVQGSLALAFVLPSGLPAVPSPPLRLRVVGRDLARPAPSARPPDDAARPDVARWAAMVVQAAVEVLSGDRPLTQMARWTTPEVYEQLQWRRQRRAGRSMDPGPPRRAVVSSVHVCQPTDEVAEACAIVRVGDRASAVALRLEADRVSWRCTAIRLG